jgi:hypothetical protein
LGWHDHIENIAKKVKRCISVLIKKNPWLYTYIEAQLKVYHAIVQPHFDYCSSVWDNCNKGLRDKLQRFQNRAGRIIMYSGYEIRSAEIMENLGWKTLEHR